MEGTSMQQPQRTTPTQIEEWSNENKADDTNKENKGDVTYQNLSMRRGPRYLKIKRKRLTDGVLALKYFKFVERALQEVRAAQNMHEERGLLPRNEEGRL